MRQTGAREDLRVLLDRQVHVGDITTRSIGERRSDPGDHPVPLFGEILGEVRRDLDPLTLAVTLFAGAAFRVVYGYYGAFRGVLGPSRRPHPMPWSRFFGVAWRGLQSAPAPIVDDA